MKGGFKIVFLCLLVGLSLEKRSKYDWGTGIKDAFNLAKNYVDDDKIIDVETEYVEDDTDDEIIDLDSAYIYDANDEIIEGEEEEPIIPVAELRDALEDVYRTSTRLNSSHMQKSRMPYYA